MVCVESKWYMVHLIFSSSIWYNTIINLQAMVSGIPLLFRLKAGMKDPYVHVVAVQGVLADSCLASNTQDEALCTASSSCFFG